MLKIEKNKIIKIDPNGNEPIIETPKYLDWYCKRIAKRYDKDKIYTSGMIRKYGDQLAWCSFICRLSIGHGCPIKVYKPSKLFKKCYNEVLDVGPAEYVEIIETKEQVTRVGGWTKRIYKWPFINAKIQYDPNNVDEKLICHQLDSNTKKDKLLKDGEQELIISALRKKGYKLERLGKHYSEQKNMQLAAKCKFFVGICSGMSHLCHAVGTPVHIIINDRDPARTKRYHRNYDVKYYINCDSFLEYIRK